MNQKQFVIASILVASLLSCTLVFVNGARRPSGGFGAIRFFDSNEDVSYNGNIVNATIFTWTPNDLSNNAILQISWFLEYRFDVLNPPNTLLRLALGLDIYVNEILVFSRELQQWSEYSTPYRLLEEFHEHPNIIPNQGSYTIRFAFASRTSSCPAFVRNICAIVTVADGMIPNQYYQIGSQ